MSNKTAIEIINHRVYCTRYRKNNPGECDSWKTKNPDKVKLHRKQRYEKPEQRLKSCVGHKLRRAIKSGRVVKRNCLICDDENSQAHHEDYNQPLMVIWLCRKHHTEYHQIKRAVELIKEASDE